MQADSPSQAHEQTPPRMRRSHTPSAGYDIVLKHEYEPMRYQRQEPPVMPRTGIDWDTQELIPPPQSDPYGPAAEPPLESCRPGGARIYDLLNEESLDRFGILAWSIVDREEEIYEHSDLTDGDKAILALWNRWIFFNRYVEARLAGLVCTEAFNKGRGSPSRAIITVHKASSTSTIK